MLVCHAEFKSHKQGFCDSRNKAEIRLERDEYIRRMTWLLRRRRLWVRSGKFIRLVDRTRAEDAAVESCDKQGYLWHEAAGQQAPHVNFENNVCLEGHDRDHCKCDREIIHVGHDEYV